MNNTLDNLFEKYIKSASYSRRLAYETIKGYKHAYGAFRRIMPEINKPEYLTEDTMIDFFEKLQTRKRKVGKDTVVTGVKDSTIKTYWSKLHSFFEWLENNGELIKNPFSIMKKPREPRYEDERALNDDEVRRIIASVSLNNDNPLLLKRDMAMVYILLYTGIRKGELLGLEVRDIKFDSHLITIRGETSKSKKTRSLPMHPVVAMHLKEYYEERKKKGYKTMSLWVSSNNDAGLSAHGIKHWVNRYIDFSGVKFHLHRFRHTFACGLAKKDIGIVKIQKLMGHSSIRMTQSYLRSIKTEDYHEDIHKLSY